MSDLDALVLASVRRGFFATARAELRGAMTMLDKMQRRAEDE
jgi:hypothetical protein